MDKTPAMIKFRTLENTSKFYWKGSRTDIDYPASFIGRRTPSMFVWSKMHHLYTVMEQAQAETPGSVKTIVDGKNEEFTPIEFLKLISDTKMWMFDKPLT